MCWAGLGATGGSCRPWRQARARWLNPALPPCRPRHVCAAQGGVAGGLQRQVHDRFPAHLVRPGALCHAVVPERRRVWKRQLGAGAASTPAASAWRVCCWRAADVCSMRPRPCPPRPLIPPRPPRARAGAAHGVPNQHRARALVGGAPAAGRHRRCRRPLPPPAMHPPCVSALPPRLPARCPRRRRAPRWGAGSTACATRSACCRAGRSRARPALCASLRGGTRCSPPRPAPTSAAAPSEPRQPARLAASALGSGRSIVCSPWCCGWAREGPSPLLMAPAALPRPHPPLPHPATWAWWRTCCSRRSWPGCGAATTRRSR